MSNGSEGRHNSPFDAIRHADPDGNDYWSARDLMPLLGYDYWQNFQRVIKKAMTSTTESGLELADHFSETTKVITVGKGAKCLSRTTF